MQVIAATIAGIVAQADLLAALDVIACVYTSISFLEMRINSLIYLTVRANMRNTYLNAIRPSRTVLKLRSLDARDRAISAGANNRSMRSLEVDPFMSGQIELGIEVRVSGGVYPELLKNYRIIDRPAKMKRWLRRPVV